MHAETIRIAFSWMHSNLNVCKSRLNAQCTAGWVAQHPINISKWTLCTISRQERIVSQSEHNSPNAIYWGSACIQSRKQGIEVGLRLHVVTSAPANEFIVCALTRIKRHVYDKLKQHTMRSSARMAKRNPARAESSFFYSFFSLVCSIVG